MECLVGENIASPANTQLSFGTTQKTYNLKFS